MTAPANVHPEYLQLARRLGAEDAFHLKVGACVVCLEPRLGSKGALLGATLRTSAGVPIVPYPVVLRAESSLDRVGKRLAINEELHTGDPRFDAAVYVETEGQDDDVRRILAAPRVREAVLEIVAGPIEKLTIGGEDFVDETSVPLSESLVVEVALASFGKIEALQRVVAALAELTQAMTHAMGTADPYRGGVPGAEVKPPTRARTLRALALVLVCLTVDVAGVAGVGFPSTPPTFGWRAFAIGLVGGIVFWLLLVVGAAALVRGRATSLRNVFTFAVFALGAIPLGARVGEMTNAQRDDSLPHVEAGFAQLRARSKGGPSYEVKLARTGQSTNVGYLHRGAVPFSYTPLPIEVTVRDGALGSTYISSLRPASR